MYHKIIRLNDYSGKMHASSISVLLKNTKNFMWYNVEFIKEEDILK